MIRALPANRPRRTAPFVAKRAIATLALALVGVACTPTPTTAPTPGGSDGPSVSSPATSGSLTTVRVYYFRGSLVDNGGLVPVERQIPSLGPVGATEATMAALLAGPNAAELRASPPMYSAMPDGTRFLELRLDGGLATINMSSEFESGGGSASAKGRLAQVVYTLTQFPEITGVRFEIDGAPVTTFSDAGLDLSAPVDRMTYTDQLPATFVDQPAWGSTIANPMRLAGLSNVFEAAFRFRLVDATGHSLADGPVMATCGTGCWGTFDERIPYTVPAAAPGTLQVWEPSAVDGSPSNVTEYPVTLSP